MATKVDRSLFYKPRFNRGKALKSTHKVDNGCLGGFGRGRTLENQRYRREGGLQPTIRRFPNGETHPAMRGSLL